MSRLWVFLHLAVLSAEDMKERQLSMFLIWELGLTGIGYAVSTGKMPELIPGLLLMAFSSCSKEQLGYGDSWLILVLGMWMKLSELLQMLLLGLFLVTIWSVLCREKEQPFVPFLTAAYMIGGWM